MIKKILVCSGEEGMRESLKLILGDHYDLVLCENASQCLDIPKRSSIGTLFLDIETPSALESLEDFASAYPAIKVILIASSRTAKDAEKALKKGASSYIARPFKSQEILSLCK